MRGNADVISAETAVESQKAFLLGHLGEAICHASIGKLSIRALGLLLQSRLDKVKGQAEETGKEAGNGAGGEGLGAGG